MTGRRPAPRGRRARRRLGLAALLPLLLACPGRLGVPAASTVTLTLALHGGAGVALHGVDAVVALPGGATVACDAVTGRIAAAALRLEGGAADGVVEGRFVPHRRAPSVRLLVASGAPLPAGALVRLTLTVPGGVPAPSAFEVASAAVSGEGGVPVGTAGVLIAGVAAAE